MAEDLVFVVPTEEDRTLITGKIKDLAFRAECPNNGSCPSGDCDCTQGCDDCACAGGCDCH